MKLSLCGQYWNKYGSVVSIEDYLSFIHENMQENDLNIMELCRMWNMIKVVIFLFIIFMMFLIKKLSSKRFHVTN